MKDRYTEGFRVGFPVGLISMIIIFMAVVAITGGFETPQASDCDCENPGPWLEQPAPDSWAYKVEQAKQGFQYPKSAISKKIKEAAKE